MLPIAMILGAILYNPITVLNEKLPHLTQALIFAMLLVPYCRISLRELRIERLHIWLIAIQIIGSLAVYGVLLLFDPLIAEGTLICILAPTATAAAVITFMLGGSLTTLATYSLLSNMTVALLSPIIFSFIGIHTDIPFTESFFTICRQMIPLLIFPFITAIALRYLLPRVHYMLSKSQSLSFYLWAVSLTIVMGRTAAFIIDQGAENIKEELLIALFSLIVCSAQFAIGKIIGQRYNERIAGGQALGQKYRSGYMDGSHLCAPHRFDRTGIVCRMAKLHQLLAVVEEKQAGQEICFCEIMKYRFSTILHHFTEKSVTNNPIDKYFLFLYIYIMNRLYITPLYHTKRLYVSS